MNLSLPPYVSFVIAGRNDDYGGDFNHRLNNSINNLTHYVERYKVPCEYIIVNYNPIDDKPALKDVLNFPKHRNYMKFRIIDVPVELHKEVSDPNIRDVVPLYEYIAKNVGIRRAKAPFICSANPDIFYSPEIVESLSKEELDYNTYYRADRCDFHGLATGNLIQPVILKRIRERVFRIFLKGFTHLVDFDDFFFYRLRKLREHNTELLAKCISEGNDPPEYLYHCNCSGDLMLMHRDHWDSLNAHPEKTRVSAHTDALFVVMAATLGLKEHVFDTPVYHQNHERRYECDTDKINPSVEAMYKFFYETGKKMIEAGKPYKEKNKDWGFAKHKLDEIEF